MAPQEISKFIQNLIKFNDNTKNAYLDCYWKAKLVEEGFQKAYFDSFFKFLQDISSGL